MKILIITISIFLLSAVSPSLSFSQTSQEQGTKKPIQTITLKDGTTLKGFLLDVTDDSYIIQTKHMGQVKIHVDDLISITTVKKPTPQIFQQKNYPLMNSLGGQPSAGQVNQLQQQLLSNPEIMNSLKELMEDAEVVNLLKDPSLQDDAFSMDPVKMQNNQSIQDLLKHPKMQEIINKAGQQLNIPVEK